MNIQIHNDVYRLPANTETEFTSSIEMSVWNAHSLTLINAQGWTTWDWGLLHTTHHRAVNIFTKYFL